MLPLLFIVITLTNSHFSNVFLVFHSMKKVFILAPGLVTSCFDNDHNFLLTTLTHSAGGEVSVLYRYLFTLSLQCLIRDTPELTPQRAKPPLYKIIVMSVNQDSKSWSGLSAYQAKAQSG